MEKTLDFLQNDGCLYKEDCVYDAAPKPFAYDCAYYEAVTAIRRREMEQTMAACIRKTACMMPLPSPLPMTAPIMRR